MYSSTFTSVLELLELVSKAGKTIPLAGATILLLTTEPELTVIFFAITNEPGSVTLLKLLKLATAELLDEVTPIEPENTVS